MTDPSQYFKGRTVQEQMTEVIGYVDTRAAEVATDAIASDVAQVHQDMLDADADASAAAASAAAAAGTLANAVKKTGESSQSIAGDIAISGDLTAGGDVGITGDAGVQGQLSVLGGCDLRAPVKIPVSPTNNDDAASKKYVDDADALKLNITDIGSYAVLLTGNQSPIAGTKTFTGGIVRKTGLSLSPGSYSEAWAYLLNSTNDETIGAIGAATTSVNNYTMLKVYDKTNPSYYTKLSLRLSSTGKVDLILESNTAQGYNSQTIATFGS